MKHISLIAVFAFALACGGSSPDVPTAPVPAGPVAGPGTAFAPDGVAIAYTVAGSGSPALVFVHGWMCDQTPTPSSLSISPATGSPGWSARAGR